MIQVCDPPRTRQVRRLSAEEFCQLAQSEVSSVYRPRSEVMRMLTVGEVWGMYSTRGVPGAGCILLPMDANVAAAAALRRFLGWNRTSGGYFLTPAAGPDGHAAETLAPLLAAAAARQEFLARQRARWAVVECAAEELIPLYLRQGFALRAIRPLDSLAPCFLLQAGCPAGFRGFPARHSLEPAGWQCAPGRPAGAIPAAHSAQGTRPAAENTVPDCPADG